MQPTSCFAVVGPPGSWKSTAVWFWLVQRVQRKGRRGALWCHFTILGFLVVVVVKSGEDGKLIFDKISAKDPLNDVDYTTNKDINVCVVDGITAENKERAGLTWWQVFSLDPSIYQPCHII